MTLAAAATTITVDCADCRMRHSDACEDCLVSWLVDTETPDRVVMDGHEARAVRLLGQRGLIPPLRLEPVAWSS